MVDISSWESKSYVADLQNGTSSQELRKNENMSMSSSQKSALNEWQYNLTAKHGKLRKMHNSSRNYLNFYHGQSPDEDVLPISLDTASIVMAQRMENMITKEEPWKQTFLTDECGKN